MAPAVPKMMPFLRCSGGRPRQASAMTTALSPPRRMSIRMIGPTAIQKGAVMNSAMFFLPRSKQEPTAPGREQSARSCGYRSSRALQQGLEQLTHFRRIAGDLEAALLHDAQLGVGRVGAAGDQRAGMAHALA